MVDTVLEVLKHPLDFIQGLLVNPLATYLVLWTIVGLESAFLVFAWLPAETSMFLAGSLAAQGDLPVHLWLLWLGYLPLVYLGWKMKYRTGKHMPLASSKLDQVNQALDTYADQALYFGRFIPIIGILLPYLAGNEAFDGAHFQKGNAIGAAIWVFGSTLVGYSLGSVPFFQENFTLLMVVLIVLPTACQYVSKFRA
jgi:membrane-associated protein